MALKIPMLARAATPGPAFFDEFDALHLVNFVAVEPHHELWIYGLIILGIVRHRIIVLLVLQIIDPALVRDYSVVHVFVVDQALLETIIGPPHHLRLSLLLPIRHVV